MRALFVVALASLLFGCSTNVSPDLASDPKFDAAIDFQRVDYDRLSNAIIAVSNAVREQNGRSALPAHRTLNKASRSYAQHMVKEGFLAHQDPTRPKMRSPEDRVRAAGGSNAKTAENIADVPALQLENGQNFYLVDENGPVITLEPGGPPVPAHTYASYAATVVEGWMNSPGHRRNLLSDEAVEIGVGAQLYRQQANIPSFVVVQKFQQFYPLN